MHFSIRVSHCTINGKNNEMLDKIFIQNCCVVLAVGIPCLVWPAGRDVLLVWCNDVARNKLQQLAFVRTSDSEPWVYHIIRQIIILF
jgi:hypothetical protein